MDTIFTETDIAYIIDALSDKVEVCNKLADLYEKSDPLLSHYYHTRSLTFSNLIIRFEALLTKDE